MLKAGGVTQKLCICIDEQSNKNKCMKTFKRKYIAFMWFDFFFFKFKTGFVVCSGTLNSILLYTQIPYIFWLHIMRRSRCDTTQRCCICQSIYVNKVWISSIHCLLRDSKSLLIFLINKCKRILRGRITTTPFDVITKNLHDFNIHENDSDVFSSFGASPCIDFLVVCLTLPFLEDSTLN